MKNTKKIGLFLRLAWEACPAYTLLLLASTLVTSGQILLNVILPKYLIDELTGNMDITRIIMFGAMIVASNFITSFLGKLIDRHLLVKRKYTSEMLFQKLSDKIMNVQYSYLETPYYLDLKARAAFAVTNQDALSVLITHIADILKNAITVIGLIAVMLTLNWILLLLLVMIMAIGMLIYSRFIKQQLIFMQQIIPVNRKLNYYVGCCFDDKLQKDARLYAMGKMLTDRVTEYNAEMFGEFQTFHTKGGKYLGFYNIINNLQAAVAYAYVGICVLTDTFGPRISLGSFTMYVNATINFTKASQDLSLAIINMMQVLGFLDPFAEFMSLPNETDIGGNVEMGASINSIRFDNVTFVYPGSDVEVLKNISFDINKGEKISIVGLNGAGKTTLVKLICRLYKPTSGKIYINGQDIFDYEHTAYMKHVAAVFQDYKLFAFTVDENITGKRAGSDLAHTGAVLEQVGLTEKMNSLDNGIYTMLGKAYDENGTEFSGGEMQKVAIARALYKEASLIILDEPTSALDPLAESEIYENFNSLIDGKTAIYISHRMSSSTFCDRILIIDNGSVSDYDSHTALMKKTDGLYYKLYMSQAENYRIAKEIKEDMLAYQ